MNQALGILVVAYLISIGKPDIRITDVTEMSNRLCREAPTESDIRLLRRGLALGGTIRTQTLGIVYENRGKMRALLKDLIKLLPNAVGTDKTWILVILREMPMESLGVVPTLIKCFSDDDIETALLATQAIAAVGAPSVPKLIDVLSGGTVKEKDYACLTLKRIGPDARAAIPWLESLAYDTKYDPEFRKGCKVALTAIRRNGIK